MKTQEIQKFLCSDVEDDQQAAINELEFLIDYPPDDKALQMDILSMLLSLTSIEKKPLRLLELSEMLFSAQLSYSVTIDFLCLCFRLDEFSKLDQAVLIEVIGALGASHNQKYKQYLEPFVDDPRLGVSGEAKSALIEIEGVVKPEWRAKT